MGITRAMLRPFKCNQWGPTCTHLILWRLGVDCNALSALRAQPPPKGGILWLEGALTEVVLGWSDPKNF